MVVSQWEESYELRGLSWPVVSFVRDHFDAVFGYSSGKSFFWFGGDQSCVHFWWDYVSL